MLRIITDGRHDSGPWSRSRTGSCELINWCCFVFTLYNCAQYLSAHPDPAVKDTYITNTHAALGNEAVIQKWHQFRGAGNNVIKLSSPRGPGRERLSLQILRVSATNYRYKHFMQQYQQHWCWVLLMRILTVLNGSLINAICIDWPLNEFKSISQMRYKYQHDKVNTFLTRIKYRPSF